MSRLVPLLMASFVLAVPQIAHAAAGDLDPTWGGLFGNIPGTITTDVGTLDDQGYGVAIQTDGKIVVVGHTLLATGPSSFKDVVSVTRYNPDGSLDTTFGGHGGAVPGTATIDSACPDFAAVGRGVVIQPDGKILIGGYAGDPSRCFQRDLALVRLNDDGTPDAGFGGTNGDPAGVHTQPVYSFGEASGYALALQPATNPAGFKIVVVGNWNGGEGGDDYAVARFNPDGSLDSSFNPSTPPGPMDGAFTTNFQDPFSRDETAFGIAVQADGKLVVVGREEHDNHGTDFAVARYNADGTLDTTGWHASGAGGPDDTVPGTEMTDFESDDDAAAGVVVQPDGHLLVAGYVTRNPGGSRDFAIARYASDGSLDTTWGTGGHVFTSFGDFDDEATAIVLQSDGKFLVSGSSAQADQTKDFALARYNADGTLDTTFGTGGKVTTDFAGHGTDVSQSMLLQPDGKIVLAGWRTHSPPDFAVARYLTDPPPPPPPTPTTTTTPPTTTTVPSSNPPGCGDTTPPVVTIASIEHTTLYAKGGRASVKVTAKDNGKLATDPSNARLRVSTGRAGRFEVSATAVDSCGNRATARFHYRVVTGPTIRIVSPASCVRSSVTATIRVSGGAALRRMVVTIGGRSVYVGRKNRIRVSAETSLMTARRHGIAVFVFDRAGHRRHAFAHFSVCPPPKALFTG